MADESQWVVAPDEARIEVAVGKDANLSPAVREALEALARAVEGESEVQGYGVCLKVSLGPCETYFSCQGVRGLPPPD